MITHSLTANELVGVLDALGVRFLTGGRASINSGRLTPADLLAQLAAQSDARVKLAIIPLLLRRPEFASAVPDASAQVMDETRQSLVLYYTAGVLLQRRYHIQLTRLLGAQSPLPDLFSSELGVSVTGDPMECLKQLGERHAVLTGLNLNWIGTYDHAAQRLIKRLEHEVLWATSPTA